MNKTIIFVGGGSMGHVTKHLAVYPLLRKDFDDFLFIGSEGGVEKEVIKDKFRFEALPVAKFDRVHLLKNLKTPFELIKAVKKARSILKRERPAVIFCGGGFTCVPVCIAAREMKIPVLLHESDYSLGLANRLSLPLCKNLLTTFEDTLKNDKKAICCGAPIRAELFSASRFSALKKFGFSGDKKVLLILGGSLGSRTINDMVEGIYEDLLIRYDILHVCGKENYRPSHKKGCVKLPFSSDMASIYAAADLAVSRCGSNTAFELLALSVPSLFIPLSKRASRGDQIQNAEYFSKRNLCRVLYEEDLTPKSLSSKIDELDSCGKELIKNMRDFPLSNANEKIAKLLRAYAKK